MAWVVLLVAGLLEIGWAVALKASDGFTRLLPTSVFLVCTIASLALLSLSLRSLPVGTAYAVWTGIGAAGTAIFGMVILHEPVTLARIAFIALIVIGAIGLQVSGGH